MISRLSRLACRSPFAAAVVAAALVAVPASAARYWTKPGVLKEFFRTAERVTYRHVSLGDAAAAAIAKQLGVSGVKR
ncbi:MAG TPA: hypothetical protein VHB21_00515, partial [Minicystis sp.]|nr:hypothetical protein [Minicystis sp.]